MIYYLNKHNQGASIDKDYWCIEICQQPFELLFIRHFVNQKEKFTIRVGLPKFILRRFNAFTI